jgi:hypothetical protein
MYKFVQLGLNCRYFTQFFRMSHVSYSWEGTTSVSPVNILSEVNVLKDEIFENRRWFHQNPEVSFKEVKTAAKVVELLRSYGIEEIWENIGVTGVVAVIRGGSPGPCIALRADMV